MRFPEPSGDWVAWALQLIGVLEEPGPAEEDFYRKTKSKPASGDYTVARTDYLIQADTTSANVTITLPESKNDGWECEVVKTVKPNRVIIVPSGTDTLVGETSVLVYVQWTALKFRAVSGGYVIV